MINQAVVNQIRNRRAFVKQNGGRIHRRLRKPPRQMHPDGIRIDYTIHLQREVQGFFRTSVDGELVDQIDDLREEYERTRGIRTDADRLDGLSDKIEAIKQKLARGWAKRMATLKGVITKTGTQVSDFNGKQVKKQFKAVLGVDVFAAEPWHNDELAMWTRKNVELCKDIGEAAVRRVETTVTEGVRSGKMTKDIAKQVQKDMGITERRAAFIARDQVGKLNGKLTELRQRGLGIDEYVWQGIMDNRERDEHRQQEGITYSWSNPPPTGNPGYDYNCRCTAVPVMAEFADLMGDDVQMG